MYKNWSLRFLIYKIITEIYLGIIYFNKPVVFNITKIKVESTQNFSTIIFQILSGLFLIFGIVFLIISLMKKEQRDWKFYTSLFGHILIIILSILFIL